jgi:hypothetical protein
VSEITLPRPSLLRRALRRGASLLAALIEWPLTGRGLSVLFLAVAGLLSVVGWLRPPLSGDILGVQLPLGIWDSVDAGVFLAGPRPFAWESVGVGLLLVIVSGAVLVLWRPRTFGFVAGGLLAAATACCVASALNHPALIARMDLEYEQRRQIVESVNVPTMQEDPLALRDNSRVGATSVLLGDEQRGDPCRGWTYLLYGRWLVLWALVGVVCGAGGSLPRRLALVGCAIVLGCLLAGLVCQRRLLAEYHWSQAVRLEGEGDFAGARDELASALAGCPDFEQLERTWLLAGKLDHRQGRVTPRERFFRVYQLSRDRTAARAVTFQEDVPWTIKRTADYREGTTTQPAGFDGILECGAVGSGTLDSRLLNHQPSIPEQSGFTTDAGRLAEQAEALALADELTAEAAGKEAPVRELAARVWRDVAMMYYVHGALFKDTERLHFEESQCLGTATAAWTRSAELSPHNRCTQFFLAAVRAGTDPSRPECAEQAYLPLLRETTDRALHADILNDIGDAYFRAGQFGEARTRYAHSFDVYNMPQIERINYRAQRRIGGL